MKTFGMGIVGTGMIAEFHARAIHSLPNAKLVAVASRTQAGAERFCAAFGGAPYADLAAMLARPDLDVLLVATPSGAHLEPVLAAARAHRHVLCEKPLEISTARIDQMIAAHQAAGTRLGCIFQFRYMPVISVLREAIRQGRFGKITYAGVFVPWWRDADYYGKSVWHGKLALDGGGALMNQSVHMLDLLCDLMPPVVSVSANFSSVGHLGIEVEDAATATLAFEGGAVGTVYGATSAFPGQPKRLEVFGTDGSAIVSDDALLEFSFRTPMPEDAAIRARFTPRNGAACGASRANAMTADLHAACFADFLHSLETQAPFAVDGVSARKPVALIERMRLSCPAASSAGRG